MPSFILRDLDPLFWSRVQAKAALEGTTVKAVILRLLSQWLAVALLVTLSAACGYKSPTSPSPEIVVPGAPVAASIQLLAASQTDHSIAISAKVLTSDGRFMSGVAVTFTTSTGTLSTDGATTDATGHARTVLTSSETATVHASAGTLSTSTLLASSVVAPVIPAPHVPAPPLPPSPPSNPGPAPVPPPPSTPAPTPTPTPTTTPLAVTIGCSAAAKVMSCNVSATKDGIPVTTQINWAQWHFGDGHLLETSRPLVTHTYDQAGTYTVYVNMRLTDGTSGSAATEITIS